MQSRIIEHKDKLLPGSFTDRYNVDKLVYYKGYDSIETAIEEEKRIRAGSRAKKIGLIENMNPNWSDLWEEIKDW